MKILEKTKDRSFLKNVFTNCDNLLLFCRNYEIKI